MGPSLRGALRRRVPSGQIDGLVSIRALKRMLIFLSLFGNPVDAARVAGLISAGDATSSAPREPHSSSFWEPHLEPRGSSRRDTGVDCGTDRSGWPDSSSTRSLAAAKSKAVTYISRAGTAGHFRTLRASYRAAERLQASTAGVNPLLSLRISSNSSSV